MKTFTRNTLALATLVVMATGFASVANAGSLAFSNLNIEGIKFGNGTLGNIFTDQTNINVLNFTNSTSNSADLASVGGVDSNSNFNNQACQGPDCGAVGGFAEQGPIGTQHFARSLSDLSGTIVDFGLGAGGATANTVAETQLIQNDSGIGISNIQLNAGFDFTLGADTFVGFTFDTTGGLHSLQNPENNVPPSNAQSNVNFTITIIDNNGATVFSWSPDGVDGNATMANDNDADGISLNDSLTAAFAGQDFSRNLAGSWFASSTNMLQANELYTLAINHTSDVQAVKEVPEPSSLALLGLGFLALGARRFRR